MKNPNEEAIFSMYSTILLDNSMSDFLGISYLWTRCFNKNKMEIREQLIAEWMAEE